MLEADEQDTLELQPPRAGEKASQPGLHSTRLIGSQSSYYSLEASEILIILSSKHTAKLLFIVILFCKLLM